MMESHYSNSIGLNRNNKEERDNEFVYNDIFKLLILILKLIYNTSLFLN